MSATAGIPYVTTGLQTARATGAPTFSCPLKGVKDRLLFTQGWEQAVTPTAPWTPLALNTPHADYPTFILVEEGPLQDAGGARMVTWQRTYAKIPDSYTEPGGSYSYNFIGFVGQFGLNETTITGRERFTRATPVHVIRDFFLVDPITGHSGGAGTLVNPYDIWESIPVVDQYEYYYSTANLKVDYIADSPPLTVATTPSRTAYDALVAAGTLIAVEQSKLTRWFGLIYMRETLKIVPQ